MLNLPVALPGIRCDRGLHVAPWCGLKGEITLLAINSRCQKVREVEIPWGSDSLAIAEELEAYLDQVDPPRLRLI